jgi:spoIIIJ-associated protein
MEWVETTGKTVEEAKERALDRLGVHHEDAEFDILEEPKAGLFGRVRGEARVRARVRPAQVRQKVDRRDRKRSDRAEKGEKGDRSAKAGTAESSDAAAPSAGGEQPEKASRPPKSANGGSRQRQTREPKPAVERTPKPNPKSSEEQAVDARQVGEEATRFMSGLVEAFGYSGAVELVEDGDDLEVRVQGKELGLMVGPRGTTLQAVQDLARVASQRRLGDHDTRLRVDIGGYRERRRQALGQFAQQMADEVKASEVARVLEPMSSADRKVIHDTLADVEGIATRSEGDDPYRRVIIAPAND